MGTQNLVDADLPPLYHAANLSSTDSQRAFLSATRIRLTALLLASAFGLFNWTLGASPTDWAGVLAACCFISALAVEGFLLTAKPERTWYEARAAAESVKTLSWRFSVGGEPFGVGAAARDSESLFLSQLSGVLDVLKDLDLVAPVSSRQQISEEMRAVRSLPLEERKSIYERDRVVDQQDWYGRKAAWNKRRARTWTFAIVAIEIAGLIAGVLKAVGIVNLDILAFAGAVVAAMTAWLQTKQHRTLATAYTVTALELASVRSRVSRQTNDDDWARFVDDAEEAFSREHTLWKASRGVRSI